jgi:integrase
MRIRLRGVNRVRKQLADGSWKIFYYAWRGKGAPQLAGEPGSPEFVASYNAAVAARKPASNKTLAGLLAYFQTTTAFTNGISERTRQDYVRLIKMIERDLADFPVAALADRRTRGIFMEWRDKLAASIGPRQADYGWSVLGRVLSVALERGKIDANPCVGGGGRLYMSARVDKVWTFDDEEAFLRAAPERLHLPLLLALWTGQRQGDLLRLPWSAYDGSVIRLRPGKSITRRRPAGKTVTIPVGEPLKLALDATPKRSPIILLNSEGKPWTGAGFRNSFGAARTAAGVIGVTFHDLRGTAVTRLALMGATEPEIAAITGHSLKDVCAILDAHYLSRDPELAWSAIRKLETGIAARSAGRAGRTVSRTDSANQAANRPSEFTKEHRKAE